MEILTKFFEEKIFIFFFKFFEKIYFFIFLENQNYKKFGKTKLKHFIVYFVEKIKRCFLGIKSPKLQKGTTRGHNKNKQHERSKGKRKNETIARWAIGSFFRLFIHETIILL